MDSAIVSVLTISGVIALGAMSPGPSFILVARTAMSSSLKNSLAVAFGMGTGCAFFAFVALLGLQSLLLTVPWLYMSLKVGGGLYLIYLAFKMFFAPKRTLKFESEAVAQRSLSRSFYIGLMTQISNPNTALVFGGIFAAILTQNIAGWMYIVLPGLAFLIDLIWYAIVACLLSAPVPRNYYMRFKIYFDRLGGVVMGLLGLKLIFQK
ncbi:LysE family translocator [Yersinia canariae]|uniref:LysE family translocator n=1 Tax=Yersinia canariae TaxID=2607663 RepID=A0A857F0L0_9GAMM|nr:LysE family translocator [Yersinia canariae]QHB32522.1 LysE family translocator [Yersinia canariae]